MLTDRCLLLGVNTYVALYDMLGQTRLIDAIFVICFSFPIGLSETLFVDTHDLDTVGRVSHGY